ncbi:antiterminator Q family protein [Enterobacteriaceae bacterium LUAb1]
MRHVKDFLEAWGNWSVARIGTEYKGMSYMSEQKEESGLSLSDAEGMIVDQAVGSLKKYDTDGYNIIRLHYQNHISCRAIARNMRRRPDYITAYLGRAEMYIAGRIHNLLDIAT